VLTALLAAAACGEEAPRRRTVRPQQAGTIEIDGEAAEDHGMYSLTGAETLSLTANDFYFEPTLITGPPGLQFQVELVTSGDTPHTFTLPEQEIDQQITGPGGVPAFTVTMPASGTVRFFCTFHRDRGMLGGLIAA
jgi:plastocyanin